MSSTSYIVKASWDEECEKEPRVFVEWLHAVGSAVDLIAMGEYSCMNGTITITHQDEVIRTYEVGPNP